MKKGIRCNETRFTNGEDRDRIRYEFLSDDGNTPSSCTVRLGDVDPVTGEKVMDVTFFREYYRLVDHQVHKNLQAERLEYTPLQKARRETEKAAYIKAFAEYWGYAPSKDDVLYHLEQLEEERWNQSVDSFVSHDTGESTLDWHPEFSVLAEMDVEIPLQLQALREVAASLTGRKAEVYEAMIQRAAGGKERIRFSEIAKKWGVAPKQITKDQERIMEMVRRREAEIRGVLHGDL